MSTLSIRANRDDLPKVIAAFAAIYVIWGTTYLAIRIAVETIPPFFMAGTRFLIAGSATFALLRARGVAMPNRLQWRSAAVIGAFLLVGGNGLVTWSEQQVPSSVAALVVAMVPLWMVLLDWLVYKGERPGKRVSLGLVLGFSGIGLLIGPGVFRGTTDVEWTSLLVLFIAPILWSFGSLQSKRSELPENVFMSTAVEMLAGGVLLLVAGLVTGEADQLNIPGITVKSLLATLYLTILGSVVALTAYVWLLQSVEPARVATYTYVNPVIAVFLGYLVLSEPITSQTIIAVAVIVLSVVLITTKKEKRKSSHDKLPLIAGAVPCESGAAGD
jgi:drug/metabolite transporter (DMT)-like permease